MCTDLGMDSSSYDIGIIVGEITAWASTNSSCNSSDLHLLRVDQIIAHRYTIFGLKGSDAFACRFGGSSH